MSAPLVSVLIPTYNGARFLAETLASAQAQTHPALEILVGDDASTDATPDILAAAAADPRVRVVHHAENVGAFLNPIILLEQARGTHVKYLLHDDLLEPDCVATLVAGMEADPAVRLAFSRRTQIDAEGRALPDAPHLAALADRDVLFDGRQLADSLLERHANLIGEMTTVLFRREDVADPRALWQLDGRRLAANGDFALWLSLIADGKAWYTPRPLSRFRRHDTQRSADPRIQAHGLRDWPELVGWARRNGMLALPEQERRALAQILRSAASTYAQIAESEHAPVVLETVELTTARLRELQDEPWRASCAVAAPAVDAVEIEATIDALRDVEADRLVLAVAPEDLDVAVPLIEAAMSLGPELDIDLVPTADPAALLVPRSVAVAPPGRAWARAAARTVVV